jgi:DNA-binding transcriptional LysR family regulator
VRIRQLQLFTMLAEVGSVSEAARRLHVTQPTATQMLKELEHAFAVQLFLRGPKGVSLTVHGERMASRVTLILRELQRAVSEGRSASLGGAFPQGGFRADADLLGAAQRLRAAAEFPSGHPPAAARNERG